MQLNLRMLSLTLFMCISMMTMKMMETSVGAEAENCPADLKCSAKPSEHERFLVNKITTKPCFVVSKSYCPYCKRAKATLADQGAKCDIIELDQRQDGFDLQQTLAAMTGRRTVPSVFIGGKTIGGSDDTVALAQAGHLKRLLKDAKAL